jgi:hypothetical protein
MPSWKFSDDYGTQYPALQASILGLLVFSDHTLSDDAFTGTLDFAASGAALATLGQISGISSLDVGGKVTNASDTLTVGLKSATTGPMLDGLAATLPILGPKLTAAFVGIDTVATTKDDADQGPLVDDLSLSVRLPIGSISVELTTGVPIHGGVFAIEGTFDNASVGLDDLSFLMGKLGGNTNWFPSEQLKPYLDKGPKLALLGISVTLYVRPDPFAISISSISVGVGLVGIPLLPEKLYMSPLGVWPVVIDPVNNPALNWSIEGSLALCSYTRPGDYDAPDMTLNLSMDLTEYTFSALLDNSNNVSINTALQDLLGQGTSIGLPTELTINAFDLEVQADKESGELSSFSADLTMSGGFGLFENLDLEEISISVAYIA